MFSFVIFVFVLLFSLKEKMKEKYKGLYLTGYQNVNL